jgi:hypothetical protein
LGRVQQALDVDQIEGKQTDDFLSIEKKSDFFFPLLDTTQNFGAGVFKIPFFIFTFSFTYMFIL